MPFEDRKANRKVATFILGYKGYIQLAIRSGQYKRLNVLAIKRGELVRYNPLYEEIEVNLISDELVREAAETIGYYAMFEYNNGFKKALYWSRQKMEQHALRYSKGYAAKKGYTFWEKDFDGMAYKTMLRQLISKWGIMSCGRPWRPTTRLSIRTCPLSMFPRCRTSSRRLPPLTNLQVKSWTVKSPWTICND